jgi:hypothetical protein
MVAFTEEHTIRCLLCRSSVLSQPCSQSEHVLVCRSMLRSNPIPGLVSASDSESESAESGEHGMNIVEATLVRGPQMLNAMVRHHIPVQWLSADEITVAMKSRHAGKQYPLPPHCVCVAQY